MKRWRSEGGNAGVGRMVSHWNVSAPKRNQICAPQLSLAYLGIQTLSVSSWNQGGPRDCNISRAVGFDPLVTTITIKIISKKSSEYCHEDKGPKKYKITLFCRLSHSGFGVWRISDICELSWQFWKYPYVRDFLFQMLSAEDKAHINDIYC